MPSVWRGRWLMKLIKICSQRAKSTKLYRSNISRFNVYLQRVLIHKWRASQQRRELYRCIRRHFQLSLWLHHASMSFKSVSMSLSADVQFSSRLNVKVIFLPSTLSPLML